MSFYPCCNNLCISPSFKVQTQRYYHDREIDCWTQLRSKPDTIPFFKAKQCFDFGDTVGNIVFWKTRRILDMSYRLYAFLYAAIQIKSRFSKGWDGFVRTPKICLESVRIVIGIFCPYMFSKVCFIAYVQQKTLCKGISFTTDNRDYNLFALLT